MKFNTIQELLDYTEKIKGKSINDVVKSDNVFQGRTNLNQRKGFLGNLVETEFYHYPINSNPEADFNKLGVELKTSGIKINQNGSIRAKERLVLNMINFHKIVNETFETSHLIEKNENLLILWYIYNKNQSMRDYKFVEYFIYSLYQDQEIIKNDFETIQNKVKMGLADTLSEGDTTYLGACPKGRNREDTTTQPFSDNMARRRAFCLKQKYMTSIIRDYCQNKPKKPHKYKSVVDYVNNQLKNYYGLSQREIAEKINIPVGNPVQKNLNKQISDRLIGKDQELKDKDDIFKNSYFIIKNTPVRSDFKPIERMSFKNIKISDFNGEWEDSYWKSYFEQVTLIIICYVGDTYSKNGDRILNNIKKISFNSKDLKSMEKTYNMIKKALEQYDEKKFGVNIENYIILLPTPKSFNGQILEILPRASKGKNSYYTLFTEGDTTKVALALNKNFLYKKLNNN